MLALNKIARNTVLNIDIEQIFYIACFSIASFVWCLKLSHDTEFNDARAHVYAIALSKLALDAFDELSTSFCLSRLTQGGRIKRQNIFPFRFHLEACSGVRRAAPCFIIERHNHGEAGVSRSQIFQCYVESLNNIVRH